MLQAWQWACFPGKSSVLDVLQWVLIWPYSESYVYRYLGYYVPSKSHGKILLIAAVAKPLHLDSLWEIFYLLQQSPFSVSLDWLFVLSLCSVHLCWLLDVLLQHVLVLPSFFLMLCVFNCIFSYTSGPLTHRYIHIECDYLFPSQLYCCMYCNQQWLPTLIYATLSTWFIHWFLFWSSILCWYISIGPQRWRLSLDHLCCLWKILQSFNTTVVGYLSTFRCIHHFCGVVGGDG